MLTLVVASTGLLVACVTLVLVLRMVVSSRQQPRRTSRKDAAGATHLGTCGALDPVSDPAYNMREVVKQLILVEEHLSEPRKYCRDCIAKHFMHVLGLLQEAEMLAAGQGVPPADVPLLEASLAAVQTQFNAWLAAQHDHARAAQIAGELRDVRKRLTAVYVLEGAHAHPQ